MKKRIYCSIVLFTSVMLFSPSVQAKDPFVTIGTAGIRDEYYATGRIIAQIVNKGPETNRIKVTYESSPGSLFNINAVSRGGYEFGLTLSDKLYQAVNGLAEWKVRGPQKDLRAVFSLYPEPVTLVAAVDTGIRDIADIKGKTVNIGCPGSGRNQSAIEALDDAGLDPHNDIQDASVTASKASEMLQEEVIDAFFYTVGHPNAFIRSTTAGSRKVRLASIVPSSHFLAEHPYYVKTAIRHFVSPESENERDIETFSPKATLVTSADVSEVVVYAVTKAVFENLDEFKEGHPSFAELTRQSMLEGLSAPVHPGALRYYRETGLK